MSNVFQCKLALFFRQQMGADFQTVNQIQDATSCEWKQLGYRYYNLSLYLDRTFGGKTWKVSVDGGFHCPNADGTISQTGCLFCNVASFSPSRRQGGLSIRQQLVQSVTQLRERRGVERVIAYFQPATNTYGPVEHLERCYREALAVPGVVGLAIGTRPDCLPENVLDLLVNLTRETWLSLEIGVQSSHNKTLQRLNRGHTWEDSVNAIQRAACRGIRVCVHLMFGLPGETLDGMLETAEKMARLPIHGVKLHNLYVAKDTGLAKLYEDGRYRPISQEEYVAIVADVLERLPPNVVIERLTAETSDEYLIAPDWCRRKSETIEMIRQRLVSRDTYQGRLFVRDHPK